MSDIILHHYPMSPFAEKIRAILGAKKLPWKSVDIPRVMPKPDVLALTGGYRKTPILQIGADIICDTALIARKLDQIASTPALYPSQIAASAEATAFWADSTLFNAAVPLAFQPHVIAETFAGKEEELQTFVSDRAAMRKGATLPRTSLDVASSIVHNFLPKLEQQLNTGQGFVMGDSPCIADFSIYHPLWFLWTKPIVKQELAPYSAISEWLNKMSEFGKQPGEDLSSTDAIKIANQSSTTVTNGESNASKFAVGDEVMVQPTDYGIDPVQGKLIHCDDTETVLLRNDDRAGEVAVHFPRVNYHMQKVEG